MSFGNRKYWLEIVGRHGVSSREGGDTLEDTRKLACKILGKDESRYVYIHANTPYNEDKGKVWYDGHPSPYAPTTPGYWVVYRPIGAARSRTSKLSAKTGKPIDINSTWKYY